MKNFIDLVPSSDEEEDGRMTLSKQNKSSPTTNPKSVAKTALDSGEGSTRENRASTGFYKAKLLAIKHAKDVQANLEPRFPSFVKSMSRSQISYQFVLVIPRHICNSHLPKWNCAINLVDENQEEYKVKYLAGAKFVKGGWKNFVRVHNLVLGDALVFQLVKPTEMKVYIIRADCINGIHDADGPEKQTNLYKRIRVNNKTVLPLLQQPGRNFRSYSEVADSEAEGIGLSTDTSEFKKVALDSTEGCVRENSSSIDHYRAKLALKHAEEIKANLEPRIPSFIKSMSRFQFGSQYILAIPWHICNTYLPKRNFAINLVDENQEESTVQYLAGVRALSRGWKNFAIAHNLVQGDALVFQLVKPTEMKVRIIRADWVIEINNSKGREKQTNLCKRIRVINKPQLPPVHQQGRNFRSDMEVFDSEVEGSRLPQNTIEFKQAKNLNNFPLAVIINSDLSEDVRVKYYELCHSQNASLHCSLYKGINTKLAAGVISETVAIADAIRTSRLSTSRDEFTMWDKKLEAFEKLGMNVCFLRNRIDKLVGLVFESEEGINSKRYKEAIAGRDEVNEQIRTVKAKLDELQNFAKRLDYEIVTHEVKVDHFESKFQTLVDSPW